MADVTAFFDLMDSLTFEHQLDADELASRAAKLFAPADPLGDAVQMMTIHKSKGLEYPLVFLPFASAYRAAKDTDLPLKWHDDQGRPRVDLRRTVDAIFWVAASSGPWKALPEDLGKWGTAHRTLVRWARAGVLETLLVKVSDPDGSATLRGLAYWLARSFRRMARIVSKAAMALVKNVLGLVDAWPAWPLLLPNANLSKIARRGLDTVNSALKLNAMLFARANTRDEREPLYKTMRLVLRAGTGSAALGGVAGLGIALAFGGILAPILFHVSPRDPRLLSSALGILCAVAAMASAVPAWRATRWRRAGARGGCSISSPKT